MLRKIFSNLLALSLAGFFVVPVFAQSSAHDQGVSLAKEGKLKESLQVLENAISENSSDTNLLADYIVVLTWDEQWQKAVDAYQKNSALTLPDYVLPEVGRAYRESGQYDTSYGVYTKYLSAHNDDTNAHSGALLSALELKDYYTAHQHADFLIEKNSADPDFHLNKVRIYVRQDQLAEAQKYLEKVIPAVEDNIKLRTALGQIYLWRGWPRKALKEFEITKDADKDYIEANGGYASALNATAQKKQARDHIGEALIKVPGNNRLSQVQRGFEVEDMTWTTLRAYNTKEFPGEDEAYFSGRVEKNIYNHHRVFTEYVRRLITNQPEDDIAQRIYLGDEWQPYDMWTLVGGISANSENGEELGGLGQLILTPDDFWAFRFRYDSKAIDIPLRSRVQGTRASDYSWSVVYRASELFNTTAGLSLRNYTDGNENWSYFWYTDTGIYTSARWKFRIGTDSYLSTNSDQTVPYFSPGHGYSFYVTPMVEHVWFRHINRSWIDRFYVGAGQIWQENFNGENAGFIRYEQDHQFTETLIWLVGTNYSLNSYDGKDSNRLQVYTTIKKAF